LVFSGEADAWFGRGPKRERPERLHNGLTLEQRRRYLLLHPKPGAPGNCNGDVRFLHAPSQARTGNGAEIHKGKLLGR
jgi:hypothetical protein